LTQEQETKRQGQRSTWKPVLPVPDGTPAARLSHPHRGEPLRTFTYRDAEGRLLGYVCRFARSAGGIHQLTLTWCRNEQDGSHAWRWMQFPRLRPMYRAERLDPERLNMVLIVADELTAEELAYVEPAEAKMEQLRPGEMPKEFMARIQASGAKLPPFLSYDIVSWPGGRTKIGEVDWSPVRGRMCAIWLPHSAERFKVAKGDPQSGEMVPIERQPWRVAARKLQDTLREHGALATFICEAPTLEELPDGWDAVRAMDAGWDLARVHEWFQAHIASAEEQAEARRLASGSVAAPTPLQASGSQDDWRKSLIREEGVGRLLAELHNVRKILTNHDAWRGVIYLDDFAHAVMKAKPPPFEGGQAGEWQDTDDSMAADWMASECGILKLKSSLVAEAVQTVAKLHARNPLVDYLNGLKWDRKPRLDTWLRDYLKAGPFTAEMSAVDIARKQDYLRIVGRKWLLGAVSRALKPGCKFDYVLILEGQQGLGKSTAFSIIGGEWTMDTPFSLGDKEGMETIRGMWVVEIAELDSFNKAESTISKSFFSRTKDRFRLPYAKRSTTFKRTCVFGGTTNENEYFRDPTGNRRYWPVRCDRRGYDLAELTAARDQLLAEAVAAVKAGEQIWPSAAEERVLREEQGKREIPDPWVGKIAKGLQDPAFMINEKNPLTRERILMEILKVEPGRMDERSMATRVGKAMHRLGYDKIDKGSAIPERFVYEKLQSSDEGDAE